MEKRDVLSRILGLFTADELKALGKQIDLKGMSKLTKGELIKAVLTQAPEEAMTRLVSTEGKKKVQGTIKNAFALLGGAAIATERLVSIKIEGGDVVARFDGMRWTTTCSARIPRAGEVDFDHSCSCKASESGAACVHLWAILLRLLADQRLSIPSLGPFAELAGETIESGLKGIKAKVHGPIKSPVDTSSKPLGQLLQSFTIQGRYERALDELGRGAQPKPQKPAKPSKATAPEKPAKPAKAARPAKPADASKPAKPAKPAKPQRSAKPPAEPFHIQVKLWRHEAGPPAVIIATLTRVSESGRVPLPFHVLIDEARQLVAHDGCKDFDIRLRRKQLLCKHLLQVFLSIDELVARRLLANLHAFEFTSVVPIQKEAPLTLPEAIKRLKPDVRVGDDDSLKGEIMEYLLANEDSPDKLGVDAIKKELGDKAATLLPVMAAEGTIEETTPGHYAPK
ncbi:MAG: SWIM zinc finger family protein [Candidatus Lokiarchaeota archaeon]|nr:SWIM zinc finger family protein [Candidatus Lokiarchaeota archaeon]